MGLIYGNNILNEKVLFISDNGKKLKNTIKEYFNSLKINMSFKDYLTSDYYNKDIQNKADIFIKKQFSNIYLSSLIQKTVTQNGVERVRIYRKCIGIKNDKVYIFEITYKPSFVCLDGFFREIEISEFKIPKEIILFLLNNIKEGYELTIDKKSYRCSKIGYNTPDEELFKKINDMINSKYKDKLSVKLNKITGIVSFK